MLPTGLDGGKLPLKVSRRRYPFVTRVFADGGHACRLVDWADKTTPVIIEIARRGVHAKRFEVLPRRSVVERLLRKNLGYRRPARRILASFFDDAPDVGVDPEREVLKMAAVLMRLRLRARLTHLAGLLAV